MIHFVVPAAQDFGIRNYLDARGQPLAERLRVVHYETLPQCQALERGIYILSALDQLPPAMERLARELAARLGQEEGVRVLNHPARTLQRLALLAELHRLGRNAFRAIRATDAFGGLRYPVFLREERQHTGAITPLLGSRHALDVALGRALLQGYRLRDLLVVEFCDTADRDGYFRKYAAFVVSGRIIPRSLSYGAGWMLKHGTTEFTRPMMLEELAYIQGNPHRAQLEELVAIAAVEYGRMDYAVRDGRVQLWEINLNPTIGRGRTSTSHHVPPELQPIQEEARCCFYERFRAALEEIDLPGDGPPVPFMCTAAAATAAVHPPARGGRLDTLRRVLRPARALLMPTAGFALPLVAWWARASAAREWR